MLRSALRRAEHLISGFSCLLEYRGVIEAGILIPIFTPTISTHRLTAESIVYALTTVHASEINTDSISP